MEFTKVLESIKTAWLIYLFAYFLLYLFLLGLTFFWSKRGSFTVEREERLRRIINFNSFLFDLVIILFHLVLIPGRIATGGFLSALAYIMFLPMWLYFAASNFDDLAKSYEKLFTSALELRVSIVPELPLVQDDASSEAEAECEVTK